MSKTFSLKEVALCAAVVLMSQMMTGCKGGGDTQSGAADKADVQKAVAQDKVFEENQKKIEALNQKYPRVPELGKIVERGENACYDELKQRYKTQLAELKKDVESTGATFVMTMLFVESDSKSLLSFKLSTPFIRSTIDQMGIDCLDFGPILSKYDPKEITQVPHDGHWSVKGAQIIADKLATLIKRYPNAQSKTVYKDSERPESFADLPPNDDEVQDGGKDLPYHIKANSQGIRMDHDLTFPKKKKRVLLIGDSGLFCPFLDNEYTIAYDLQKMFPDYEIYTIAAVNWTTEDFLSLWNSKAKYTEPDLVIVGTNASDVEDLFFTNRNHCSRTGVPFYPSPTEEKFYQDMYR